MSGPEHGTPGNRRAVALSLATFSLALFAGCIGDGSVSAADPAGVAMAPPEAGPDAPTTEIHNITISMGFTTAGVFAASPAVFAEGAGVDPPSCESPTAPQTCQAGVHETMVPGDMSVLNGTFVDTAWVGAEIADRHGYWVFTGSVAGCTGSGTFTMPWTGGPDEEPIRVDASGEVLHAHDYLTAPTSFEGFANMAGGWIDADYYVGPTIAISDGTLTGYLLCE